MSKNKRGLSDTNYTNVTFEEIRKNLVNRAKNYYPSTYQDFNKTSFGSLIMDMVSMVGEQLNFYTQFVANENFLETSRTAHGLVSAARNNGIEIFNKYTSVGNIKIYSRIPANASLSTPDTRYKHTILKGMVVTSNSGVQYTTTKDVQINLDRKNFISSEFSDDASRTTYYVYEIDAPVVSGESRTISVDVGTYQKFLKVEIKDDTITEVLSVFDENGNEYYQVENLSQDTIYREVLNRNDDGSNVSVSLVPVSVPRRFTIQHEGKRTFLVFGFGSEDSLKIKNVADPSQIAMQLDGRDYVTDISFDPSRLLSTDKFGVGPQNTTLTITYRSSTVENSNTAAGTLTNIISSELVFENQSTLDAGTMRYIKNSITCENVEPVNGSLAFTSTQEVAETIRAAAGQRGRAVTLQDYVAACYAMPSRFGSIKRAAAHRDFNDLKRNLNIFVISHDHQGYLQSPSSALKNNLRRWLNSVRMVSDTIDIHPAHILNLGIYFDISLNNNADPITAVSEIRKKVFYELNLSTPQIGESFSLGEIEKIMSSIPIIRKVNSIQIANKRGEGYSDKDYDIQGNLSPDGGSLYLPHNFIWEIKNESDITGKIK